MLRLMKIKSTRIEARRAREMLLVGLALVLAAMLLGLGHNGSPAAHAMSVAIAADAPCSGGTAPDPSDHGAIGHMQCPAGAACQLLAAVSARPPIDRARPIAPALLAGRVADGRYIPPEQRPPIQSSRV
ncbi:MAG: hypothetical protein ACOY3L_01975 [Pseudomonadota bacterium]